MKEYIRILQAVAYQGELISGRNGDTLSISGAQFKHDMRNGFPALTIRRMSIKNALTEARFFMLGGRDKLWLQERGNHFWDKFCNKHSLQYLHDRERMTEEVATLEARDLGPIYGCQWRNFNNEGVDQLKEVIATLNTYPTSRRMLVSAWNPTVMPFMALPPCHDSFQFLSNGKDLDLIWRQRSCDMVVGLPYDILLYALILTLVAKEVNMNPRYLTGHLGSVHIYEQHSKGVIELLTRNPKILPEIFIPEYEDIWKLLNSDSLAKQVKLLHYVSHENIKFECIA